MRKTIVTALIALTVMLAVASCDSPMNVKESEDGMVTLSVITDGVSSISRSLVGTSAQSKSTYMEVIFIDGSDVYHADDFIGLPLSIKIPVGTYKKGTSKDAIILIGRQDGTLLATGRPTDYSNSALSNSLAVAKGTATISFTVTPLAASLPSQKETSPGTYDATYTPSFKITDTAFPGDFPGNSRNGTFIDDVSPCFQVPLSPTTGTAITVQATLSITGFADTGTDIKVVDATSTTLLPATVTPVKINGIGGATALTVTAGSVYPTTGDDLGGDTTSSPAIPAGTISFEFNSPQAAGFYTITFNIPVKGFDNTNANLRTWYIRGGIKSGTDLTVDIERDSVALSATDSPKQFATPGIIFNW